MHEIPWVPWWQGNKTESETWKWYDYLIKCQGWYWRYIIVPWNIWCDSLVSWLSYMDFFTCDWTKPAIDGEIGTSFGFGHACWFGSKLLSKTTSFLSEISCGMYIYEINMNIYIYTYIYIYIHIHMYVWIICVYIYIHTLGMKTNKSIYMKPRKYLHAVETNIYMKYLHALETREKYTFVHYWKPIIFVNGMSCIQKYRFCLFVHWYIYIQSMYTYIFMNEYIPTCIHTSAMHV